MLPGRQRGEIGNGMTHGKIPTSWPCIQHPPSEIYHHLKRFCQCPGFRDSRRCCNASKICRSWWEQMERRFVLDSLSWESLVPPFLQEVQGLPPNSLRTNFEIMSDSFWSAVNTIHPNYDHETSCFSELFTKMMLLEPPSNLYRSP